MQANHHTPPPEYEKERSIIVHYFGWTWPKHAGIYCHSCSLHDFSICKQLFYIEKHWHVGCVCGCGATYWIYLVPIQDDVIEVSVPIKTPSNNTYSTYIAMKHCTSHKTSTASYSPAHEYTSSQIRHIYGVSVVISGGLPTRQLSRLKITTNHHWNIVNMQDLEWWVFAKASCSTNTAWPLWMSHSLDKIVAFYQHTNNHHSKFWWWFAVVCGGLWWFACIVSGFTAYRPKFWWWFVVVCGDVWWFWWFACSWNDVKYHPSGMPDDGRNTSHGHFPPANSPSFGLRFNKIAIQGTPQMAVD